MQKPKIIAFYLPQYHPTPDNDKWWGKGFTEWTNVGKAKPLFPGHYQPKVPADLGYYDLRLPEVREAQAELAKEAGIYGFCYYHYWFGNGKEELELPFNEVLRLGKPDFPFMLCWANESWHKKFWNKDGIGSSKEILIEQTYPGEKDMIDHFYRLLPAFKDQRYIKINGKLAFMVYKPLLHPEMKRFTDLWQELAKNEGLPGFTFIGHMQDSFDQKTKQSILDNGFSYCNTVGLYFARTKIITFLSKLKTRLFHSLFKYPILVPFDKIFHHLITPIDHDSNVIPTVMPNWDHTPRSGSKGWVLTGCSPDKFKIHLNEILKIQEEKTIPEKYIFLKSWNEWGEGNYIEPDLVYGKGYIEATKEALKQCK